MSLSINKRIKNAMLTTPYPYQWEGIRFFEDALGRCFCWDTPGCGKSLQALAYTAIHPELRPVLVICPASLKINWKKEARMHIGQDAIVLCGTKPHPISWPGIYIINYDIVSHWVDTILAADFKILIADECHALRNLKAKRTKACKRLSMHIPHFLGLTGTPISNRPAELFSLLNIMNPALFPSWFSYINKYCNVKRMPWGMDYSGSSNLEELHEIIKPYYIRRKKEDVLKDLPEKQRFTVPVEISNRKEYDKAQADFLRWLERVKPEKMDAARRAESLVKLATLRNLVVQGKMDAIHEWVDNYLESDKKLILFMCHVEPLHEIYQKHKKHSVMIDGSVSMKKRDAAVVAFQNDPKIRLFCGNIIAAGEGLTLTAADTVVFGELSYVPKDHEQGECRHHRIGQTSDSVQCYYIIADNTLEEKVCSMLHSKMQIVDQILDGAQTDSDGWNFKRELLIALKNRK